MTHEGMAHQSEVLGLSTEFPGEETKKEEKNKV